MAHTRMYAGLFIFIFGLLALATKLNSPRVRAAVTSDIVALIAVGLSLGVGLVLLLGKYIPSDD